MTEDEMLARVKKIDAMFEGATGWGSWMVMYANEREALVDKLAFHHGVKLKHKYQARTSDGGHVS